MLFAGYANPPVHVANDTELVGCGGARLTNTAMFAGITS
jgi:hypothetical protein